MSNGVNFRVLDGRYAVVKLAPGAPLTPPKEKESFWSVTLTDDELSLVCLEDEVPRVPDLSVERCWRILEVAGPLDFNLKGILASLLNPLSDAGVSVFALSTYNTDYILVQEFALERAVRSLESVGHIRLATNVAA